MDGREPPLHTLSPSLLPCVHALCSFSPSLTLALTSKVTPPLSTRSRSCINALTLAPSLPNSYSLPTCPCALTPQLIPRLVFLHLYSLPHSCSLLLPPLLTPLLPQSILHSLSCTHFLLTFQLISCAPPLTPCLHYLPKCTCAHSFCIHTHSLLFSHSSTCAYSPTHVPHSHPCTHTHMYTHSLFHLHYCSSPLAPAVLTHTHTCSSPALLCPFTFTLAPPLCFYPPTCFLAHAYPNACAFFCTCK